MKTVYILRGIPGSGKTTLASSLVTGFMVRLESFVVCCADDYHIVDDVYKWQESRVADAHAYCRGKFVNAITREVEKIVISNTNTTYKEFQFYKDEGIKAGYEIVTLIVGEFSDTAIDKYAARNVHGVPRETIKRMRDRFQL